MTNRFSDNPDVTLCIDCKQARKAKAKEWLRTAGKVVGIAAVTVGAVYVASQSSGYDDNTDYKYIPDGDDGMRCANCGNTDENTL